MKWIATLLFLTILALAIFAGAPKVSAASHPPSSVAPSTPVSAGTVAPGH